MSITHILFDFDGTLADTNELIARSHLAVVEHYYPGRFNRQTIQAFNGPSLEQVYLGLDASRAKEMVARYQAFNEQHHDDLIAAFPQVLETLRALKDRGIHLGIASTKRRKLLERGLNQLGLNQLIDFALSGDDCQQVKPSPEIIQLALEKWQVAASNVVMVGDNWQDLAAAEAAGVASAFVQWSEKKLADLKPYHADYQIERMADFLTIVGSEALEDRGI